MLTQRQMRASKRDADICHSIIKRKKLKNADVSFMKCGCCGVDGYIKIRRKPDEN